MIEDILRFLKDDACYLRSLALVRCRLTPEAMAILSGIITVSGTLYELDVSWNDLRAKHYS